MKLVNFSLYVSRKNLISNANIDFYRGRVNHLLGKNGTGKSCFVKAIIGAIPYKGSILIEGKRVGAIGNYSNLPSDLRGKDIIQLIKRNHFFSKIKALMETLGMEDFPYESKIKNLSDGQRQKLKLVYFLSFKPDIVLLDEITNALDKKSSLEIYSFLNDYIKTGVTIINVTHNLSDLEYLDGEYFLLIDRCIEGGFSKDEAIRAYIRG